MRSRIPAIPWPPAMQSVMSEIDVGRAHTRFLQRPERGGRGGGEHQHGIGSGGRHGQDPRAGTQGVRAYSAEVTNRAAAPSAIPLELPAV
jgi:hypothetical protein